VILADGEVMAVGGTEMADDPTKAVLAGEIWNPATGRWRTVASMAQPRMYHSASLLLPDGRVLTAGGEPSTAGPVTPKTAQVYSPPYLFAGPRPTISSAPAGVRYGTSFPVGTPNAAGITSVALIRPSAVTHAYNMDQRYVPLAFRHAGGALSATAPANGNIAPPGYYMLVIKTAAGVPSVAKWIHLSTTGATTGAPAPSTPAAKPTTKRPAARVTVKARARIRLRTIRRRGLAITLHVPARARVVRIRLYRRMPGMRHLVATAYRSTNGRRTIRVTLRSPRLRTLRPGSYDLQVAAAPSRSRLGPGVTRRLSIVR
jgi:hypothetical protein